VARAREREQAAVTESARTDASVQSRTAWVVAAITAGSVFLHFWKLGVRPLAHDEAIDAWFSWRARNFDVMEYDPVYHGPLRFYLEGLALRMFGTGAAAARLVAALAGVGATVLIATRRELLGRVGAPVAAVLFVVSPTALTVTRTGREDSLTGLVSLGVLLVIADALRRGAPTSRHIVVAALLLGVSFTIKETTFIFGFAGACFFAGLAIVAWRRAGAARAFWQGLARLGTTPWMWAAVAFLGVVMIVFTSGFRYAGGLESGLLDGLRYWLGQHEVGRGSQRWFFYLTILGAYEWLVVALAIAGGWFAWRARDPVGGWLATTAVVQLAVYSWAGEKFAWLMLHPLLPLVLLAGRAAQHVWDTRTEPRRKAGLAAAFALVAAGTLVVAVRPAITHGHDPRELLVAVHTSERVHELAAELRQQQRAGEIGPILVDQREGGSWPWAWYLHGMDVQFVEIDPAVPLPDGFDVYIVAVAAGVEPAVPPGHTFERYALRAWWLPEYGSAGVGDVLRWLFTRTTWNPTGSSDQFLIRRG
jgi:uncharacterized protein (TIGR03663 family)